MFLLADESVIQVIVDMLRRALQVYQHEQVGDATASFGLATLQPGNGGNSLIKWADNALYEEKWKG